MHIRFRDGQLNHLATAVGEKVETGVEQGTAMSAATRRGLHPHGANVANAVYVARRRHEAPVRPKDEHGHSRDAKALGTGAPSVITQRCGVLPRRRECIGLVLQRCQPERLQKLPFMREES